MGSNLFPPDGLFRSSARWGLLMTVLQDGLVNQVTAQAEGHIRPFSAEGCEACTVPGQLYRHIVETMREGLWVLDNAGITTFVNRPMAAMLGYQPAEMIGRPLFDFMDDAARVAAHHYFQRRMQGISEDHEFRFLNKQGESVWTKLSTRSLMNDAGEFQGTLATIQDLTGQRHIEKRMLENQAGLRLFLNELPATAWAIDRDFILQSSYGAGLKTFGLENNQLAGHSLIDFLATFETANREGLIEIHKKALAGQSVQAEFWYGDRLIHNRVEPIQAPGGEVIGAIGISLDVTEQHLAQQELARSEARLRTILQTAPDAILTTDDQGTILSANSAAEQLFGRRQSDLTGSRLDQLILGGPRARPSLGKESDHDTSKVRLKPADLLHQQGSNLLVRGPEGRLIPVEISAGQVDHLPLYTLIVRNVSYMREMQLQLVTITEDQQRRIGRELHDDLGQEITGAAMLAEALTSDVADLPSGEALLPLAQSLSRRLVRAQKVVRSLARGLAVAVIDTSELLLQLDELAASVSSLHGVECIWQPPDQPLHLDTEMATQLFRMAQEAVTNALKHSGASRIEMALSIIGTGPDRTIALRVADNGRGLPEKAEDRARPGMGTRIMHYRAGLIGAVLTIHNRPQGGTQLLCLIKEHDNHA